MPSTSGGWIFNPAEHKSRGESFVLWRLPGIAGIHCIICSSPELFSASLVTRSTGFVAAPFDADGSDKALFFSGEYYLNPIFADGSVSDFWLNSTSVLIETAANYKQNVALCVDEIKKGSFKKAVIARNESWDMPLEFSPLRYFQQLCTAYPEAFVSLVSSPETGTWTGATPETLLEVTPEHLKTVALAGTRLKSSSLAWGEKESEEQAWVLRYITELLKKEGIDIIDVTARTGISNGPLEHLYNEIKFKKTGISNSQLAARVLPALHPTPAVCGLPADSAKRFILENEKFARSYYSGYLGPVNSNGNTSLFVNLRCMQITEQDLIPYAGAGITIDSDPEKEFIETGNKMANLRRVL
ncbi:MAG TPA: chorismate-binding protein [Bacteroidia bacterium]|nr:chorismate-binding protein [Bacteroidia bacterium]